MLNNQKIFFSILSLAIFLLFHCDGGSSSTPDSYNIGNNKYTITYNGNGNTGGTIPTDSSTYIQGQHATILGNTGSLLKTGYRFEGWNTESNGTGTGFFQNDPLVINSSSVVLYAKWSLNHAAWARTLSDSGSGNYRSLFNAVTVDPSGNIYAAGTIYYNSTYNFGAGITTAGLSDNNNLVLVKYNPSGIPLWANTVSSSSLNESYYTSLATDSSGNIYAAGIIKGVGNYNFGNGITAICNESENNILVKYDTNGIAQWALNVYNGIINSITTDINGNIYVAGRIYGAGSYNFGNSVYASGTFSGLSAILVKYSSTGSAIWAKSLNSGPNQSRYDAVTADSSGNIYAAGYIWGTDTYNFGNNVTAAGLFSEQNVLLIKYNSLGTAQWAKTVTSGSSYSYLNSLATDASDNIYAKGIINNTMAFNFGNSITVTGESYGENTMLIKYNSLGTPQWAKSITGKINAFTADTGGNVFIAGNINSKIPYTFGNGVSATANTSSSENAFMVKYNSSGIPQWADTLISGSAQSNYKTISADGSGNIYSAGSLFGSSNSDFGNDVKINGVDSNENILLVKYK